MVVIGVGRGIGAQRPAGICSREINTYRGSAVDRDGFLRNILPRVAGRSLSEVEIRKLGESLNRRFGYLPNGDTEFIASTGQYFWITQTGDAGCGRLALINLTEFVRQELDGEAEGERKAYVGSYDFSSNRAKAWIIRTTLKVDNENGSTGCPVREIDLAAL